MQWPSARGRAARSKRIDRADGDGVEQASSRFASVIGAEKRNAKMRTWIGALIVISAPLQVSAQEMRIQVGATAAPASPPAPSVPHPSEPPPVSLLPPEQSDRRPGRPIEVFIDSPNADVLLEEQHGRSTFVRSWRNADGSTGSKIEDLRHWEAVCQTPCGISLDSGGLYRIAGPGVIPSGEFMLLPNQPMVSLKVKSGDVHRYRAGIALMAIGPVLILAGVLTAALLHSDSSRSTYIDIGVTSIAVGAGGVAAGAALFATNGTRVRQGTRSSARLGGLELSSSGIVF
jgi:hypothetical protein